MRNVLASLLLLGAASFAHAQATFKCGWTTYKTAAIIHEYTYSYTYSDSFKLYLADSSKTFIAPDSAATLTVSSPYRDNSKCLLANYYNVKKKVIKSEEYKDALIQVTKEYKYDDKNRKVMATEDNRQTNGNFKKTYDYNAEKNGDMVINEVSYYNGRKEFYTKTYIDKNNQKYKEVRLNDNNKDIVHVENFTYNQAGKLKERSVYFPEFKVTKKFPEPGGDLPAKCFRSQPLNISDKPVLQARVSFLKKVLNRNSATLLDPECHEFEYRFFSPDCEVIISTTKTNNVKQVIFRYKEKF